MSGFTWGSFSWGEIPWGATELFVSIYDRTQSDVDYVSTLSQSIKNGESGLPEYLKGLKGALNYADLNRIENNTIFVKEKLESNGYIFNMIHKTNWTGYDIITLNDLNRIRSNVQTLLDCGINFEDTLEILTVNSLNYEMVNALEFNIYLLNYYMNTMVSDRVYCGEFCCAET